MIDWSKVQELQRLPGISVTADSRGAYWNLELPDKTKELDKLQMAMFFAAIALQVAPWTVRVFRKSER